MAVLSDLDNTQCQLNQPLTGIGMAVKTLKLTDQERRMVRFGDSCESQLRGVPFVSHKYRGHIAGHSV